MCSTFEIGLGEQALLTRFKLLAEDGPPVGLRPDGVIRPTDRAPVILPGRILAGRGFGLAAPWDGKPLINARSETVLNKPVFAAVTGSRCLVPATGYYEWRKAGTQKIKTRITLPRFQPFFMAGLFDEERFTVLTCRPADSIAHIHNRMPVILGPRALKAWLDPSITLHALTTDLAPCPDEELVFEESQPNAMEMDLFSQSKKPQH